MKIQHGTRWLLFAAFTVCLCLSAIGLGLDLLYHLNIQPKVERWNVEKLQRLPQYLQEAQYFQSHLFFGAPSKRESNLSELTKDLWPQGFAISLKEKETLLGLKDEWLESRFRVPKKNVTKLFGNLAEFDYFQPSEDSIEVYPFDFVALSQIRLAHAVDAPLEDQSLARMEVRKLAALLIWSQDFNFQLASLSILEKEAQFAAYLGQRKPAEKQSPVPIISAAETRRFRNFIYGTYDYLDLLMPADVLRKIFLNSVWPIGYCAVIQAKAPSLSARRPFFDSSWPLEPTFKTSIEAYDKILAKASEACVGWRSPSNIDPPLASKLPFLRRLIGLRNLIKNKSMAQGL